ncbi:ABC transporter ATP-binding protein [Opitutus terrae]|uniref:ABC transporter related n=1 Tax=Opitutus terrae (strain DSM 11246 / JCM 15787 / PB90-1) TaxID=452637 RepID=B1ZQD1_OPITP|nr:ABC transporter ATP-binding protein [Opitutus terrae]ACB73611.1 ABC transporter related [Opitutus terrae PB90-1]
MIELTGIHRTYTRPTGESVAALADFSLRITRGELVAIIGASGSGKSTLMNILGLLDRPERGTYRFDGHDVADLDVAAQARFRNQHVGFVFQAFHLLPRTTALENVELPLLYSERASTDGLARRALEAVGLADRIEHTPSELSGGQQQRVAIARALVNEPELLLADEPTGNLDADSAREILDLFVALNRAGRTIVLVTHDPATAARAQRVVRLERGRLASDSVARVADPGSLSAVGRVADPAPASARPARTNPPASPPKRPTTEPAAEEEQR